MKTTSALGFTLIEMLVTLGMMAIVLALGVPAFKDTVRGSTLTADINEFIAALNFARSEAIKRGMRVTVAKTGTYWEQGWQVFTDNPTYGTVDGTDAVLRVHGALQTLYSLRGNNNFTNFISYQPSGVSNNPGSFALCYHSSGSINDSGNPTKTSARLIIVSILGRITLATDNNNDGVLEKINSNGTTPLTDCTDP